MSNIGKHHNLSNKDRLELLKKDREIQCNEAETLYLDNSISTSKYTCLTFIPINLYEQFSKMANIYFLIIGLMQIVDEISISEGVPVIYLPLVVVVAISALKDLFEDLKRHNSDNDENMRKVKCYREKDGNWNWIDVHWKEIRVGEIIQIHEDEYLPCDILVIKSSDDQGYAFIETKNLDGETNLKRKQAPKDTQAMDIEHVKNTQPFTFNFEPPNPYLYNFKGTITTAKEKQTTSLGIDNFILRGCSLRNTKYIIGLASYTGHDTKIMLNSVRAKPKSSKVEKQMNNFIIAIFVSQIIVCFITAIIAVTWYQTKIDDQLSYLDIESDNVENGWFAQLLIKWGTWILIFTNFVPISLLVTVEMVKFVQGIFISFDENCKTKVEPIIAATVQASNLNEELGQVEYIFSDKTGTLTANVMKYKVFSINGVSYGDNEKTTDQKRFKDCPNVTNVDFWDYSLLDDINKDYKILQQAHFLNKPYQDRQAANCKVYNSLMFLGLCHTIITDKKVNDKGEEYLQYNASSPDELALLNFAKFVGFEFMGTDKQNCMTVKFRDQLEKFKLLHVLEFDSTRKRMSVILKHVHEGVEQEGAILYTKGADSVIEKLLKDQYRKEGTHEFKLHKQTWEHLERYGQQGLRTLLCAEKYIKKEDFEPWNKKYIQATEMLEGREEAQDKLQSELEINLDIIGATAIEDQLQDKVGETIYDLKRAGIKIWVLTGDKIETAVNIGYSCKLLDDSLYQLQIDGTTPEMVLESLKKAKFNLDNPQQIREQIANEENQNQAGDVINENDEYDQNGDENNNFNKKQANHEDINLGIKQNKKSENEKKYITNDKEQEKIEFALLLTGDSLIHAMKDDDMQAQIMDIAHNCKAVMCCRVSPKQKQEVVTMVRKNLPEMTSLAIGDGANDVNMITAAHVGIGIRGVEGQQAARASDFAIGEFKILKELLLHHGRECYRKNSALIGYNFYKNMLLVLPQGRIFSEKLGICHLIFLNLLFYLFYAFVNGFSGASNYDPYIYQLYNIFYTSLPIVVYAIFDVEFSRNQLVKQPKYYSIGLRSELFNKKEFFIWIFFGVWQACICGWFAYLASELNFVNEGRMNYFASSGMVSFHNSVLVGNLKVFLFSYSYTLASTISIFGSIIFFITNHYIGSTLIETDMYNCFNQTYQQGNFWFQNIVLIGAAVLIDMFIGRYRQFLKNDEYKQEIMQDEKEEAELLVKQKKAKLEQEQEMERQKQAANNHTGASMGQSQLTRSQRQRSNLGRSYTGFGFSQTEAGIEKEKSQWQTGNSKN